MCLCEGEEGVDRVFLGLSVRSWISLGVLLSALLVVLGYAVELRTEGGMWIARLGILLGSAGILVGALPLPEDSGGRGGEQ